MLEVLMPRLSDSMEEGTIVRWLQRHGAAVTKGQDIIEIETDKAQMNYEAEADGVLSHLVDAGATVAVGTPIASIGPVAATRAPSTRVNASSLARRIAADLGVDVATVRGSGPHGRVVKADVVKAAGAVSPATPSTSLGDAADVDSELPVTLAHATRSSEHADRVVRRTDVAAAAQGARGAVTLRELSRLQNTVANRMSYAKSTVPDFSVSVDVNMSDAVQLRAALREQGARFSLNDLIVKATATALREQPRANGSFTDQGFESYSRINVGVAVASDDALVVPTIFDADRKTVSAIGEETRRLADRVRSGDITPPELEGGTFTVSNLGMFGIDAFTGVVNPPQAAILCAGAVTKRPVVSGEDLVAGDAMTLTLVCDHRILYGADAARLLGTIKDLLEAPARAIA